MGHTLITAAHWDVHQAANAQGYYNGSDWIPNTGDENFGQYQFISLNRIIDNFMATYVGENKILPLTHRGDVTFHAHRALAELSFDTFKSCKTQEITLPPHLTMPLPRDYVNYVKLAWSDGNGIEHIIYPTSKTSNPKPILQNDDGDYALTVIGTFTAGSTTVTLDKEYSTIRKHMWVRSPSINVSPTTTKVLYTTNAGGITTMEMNNAATFSKTETINLLGPNRGLLTQPSSSHIVENLTWDTTNPIITASSAADISDIEVGMTITGEGFGTGGTMIVRAINDAVITYGWASGGGGIAVLGSGAVVDNELTFIQYRRRISDTWSKYKDVTPSENNNNDDDDNTYSLNVGQRYGIDPQYAQANGSFFIDCDTGMIHFSSNLSGKDIILKYISDSLGTDEELQVHKFAEEAVYKWIIYGCLIAILGIPEYVIQRFKKEKFAETRKAKLRLSNIKLEEITQIMRGKSKWIKH
jgi:hypothetical protein